MKLRTGAFAALAALVAGAAQAENITLRIGSGHPPGVVYANLMINFFQKEVSDRVAARTAHTVNGVEGYAGSIVKVNETLTGVQDGILDIGVSASASSPRACRCTPSR
jgi:TRAP-type C4-dicarboxylate transport system substrate-binding protein